MESAIDAFVITGIYIFPMFILLGIGGIFSDYILPRCPRLIRFLERMLDVDLSDDPESMN